MSQIKWIKIAVNIFDDEKMRFIESLPDGDTIIVIWMKLLTLAGRSNSDGFIMLTENIPYTEDMLRSYLNRKDTIIKLALETFKKLKMIELVDEEYLLVSSWQKHQNVTGMEHIKELNRKRQADYRKKQKDLLLENKDKRERDKDIDTNNVDNNVTDNVTNNVTKPIPYKVIVDYLNSKTEKNFKTTAEKTKKDIQARWNEGYRLDDFKKVIDLKVKEWKGDPKMDAFLRPSTLFSNKFEGYLNQKDINKPMSIKERQELTPSRVGIDI